MITSYETNSYGEQIIVKTYHDGTVIKELDRPAPVNHVPQSVSMRQARLALYGGGLLDDVEAAVASSTKDVQIEWEFSSELRRDWPTLVLLAGALGLTESQIDGLFIQAATL